jgi:hypothetical protein
MLLKVVGKASARALALTLVLHAVLVISSASVPPASAAQLPDGRAYELVTPPDLGAPALAPEGNSAVSQTWSAVAADGSGVLWTTRTILAGIDSTGATDTFLARRGSSNWASTFVSPPGSRLSLDGAALAWATPNLDSLVWWTNNASIDPQDQDPSAGTFIDFYRRDAAGVFTRMSQGSQAPPVAADSMSLAGVSKDAQALGFTAARALEPGAAANGNVYVRRGAATTLVNIDQNGVAAEAATGAGLSDDGDVAAFTANGGLDLYLRDQGRTHTEHVAHASGGIGIGVESLSADGSKLFFFTASPLVAADTDTSVDLYEYDTSATTPLTRVSGPAGGSSGPGNTDACTTPLPILNACDIAPVVVSRDGSRAYFVSPEQLDDTNGTDGATNLYLAQAGTVRFVATLDPSDPDFGQVGGVTNSSLSRHVRPTPDGSKLLFESRARITSYDNAGHVEIYMHDPDAGTVVCVSCRPSGDPPTGDASLREGTGSGSSESFSKDPLWPANADQHGDHVFFHSTDAIVPQDVNGSLYDVYEYTSSNGGIALLSSGRSPNDSVYLGNGADGKDVFFFTTDTLAPQDENGSVFKVYDARVGGGFPPPPPDPPVCAGESCRGASPSAPDPAQPGTGLVAARSKSPAVPSVVTSKLTVSGARSVKGTSARLTAKVAGAGRLEVSGSGVTRSSVAAKRAATYHVTVRLTKASAAKLRRAGRLAMSVTVRFVPATGSTRSVRVRMTFSTTSKKKGR